MIDPFGRFTEVERTLKKLADFERAHKAELEAVRFYREYEELAATKRNIDAAREQFRIESLMRDERNALRERAERRFFENARMEADAIRQVSQASAFESTRRLHQERDEIRMKFDRLQDFGHQSLREFAAARELDLSASRDLFRSAAASVLNSYPLSLDANTVHRIQLGLDSEFTDDSEVSLADVVTQAVFRALRENGSKPDWRFIWSIVLGMLMFLYQDYESKQDKEALQKRLDHIEEKLIANEQLAQLLLTKIVKRATKLKFKPTSKSRILCRLEAGTSVVVVSRRNKWTYILVRAQSDSAFTVRGWILNKYLE